VVGRPDDYWGEAVVAFFVPRRGTTVSANELKQHCKSQLSGYKIPKEFILREHLPKNATGKILHRVLREELKPQ